MKIFGIEITLIGDVVEPFTDEELEAIERIDNHLEQCHEQGTWPYEGEGHEIMRECHGLVNRGIWPEERNVWVKHPPPAWPDSEEDA